MLCQLTIQDIVLIDRLTLDIGEGLTALTGETGAGKSILLDSLSLAMGAKADKALVRHGAEKGMVAATFEAGPDHPVWSVLDEGGLPTEDDTVTLRRVQMADGRSRAFVNDQACSVGLLREVGGTLIEIHGQNQSLGFLNPSVHRSLLDHFAGVSDEARHVGRLWATVRRLAEEEEAAAAAREEALREADYLRHIAGELDALDPQAGEEQALAERRAVLQAAEKVAGDLTDAVDLLGDDGPSRRLSTVAGALERAASRLTDEEAAPLRDAVARLDAAIESLGDARMAVVEAGEAFALDPRELNEVEERLFALRAAGRKLRRAPDDLAAYRDEVARSLARLDEGEAENEARAAAMADARRAYDMAAAQLSAKRLKAAKALDKAVAKELAPLKLGHATFKADVTPHPDEPGASGFDTVAFKVSTNPGAPLGPLGAIASGGELSRFVLALKAALVERNGKTVIIFDEVDSGVGGAVADAVGERLARIAEGGQVLVVTHSPQVAARGRAHLRVEKSGRKTLTTKVRTLAPQERVEEIARMLSGATITKEARAAAETLLGHERVPEERAA